MIAQVFDLASEFYGVALHDPNGLRLSDEAGIRIRTRRISGFGAESLCRLQRREREEEEEEERVYPFRKTGGFRGPAVAKR